MDQYFSTKEFPVKFKKPWAQRHRSHRVLQLSNGILALLMSDPTEVLGSASICVASGSFNDPDEVPGLAHFCEHLLFLGNKLFPDPGSFHRLILTFEGGYNAFTTGEQTCFYFEVPSSQTFMRDDKGSFGDGDKHDEPVFDLVLENFAAFFHQPSFANSSIRKEVNSVNDEHACNIRSRDKVLHHGLRLLANDLHPFSRFCTGNQQTIADIPKSINLNIRGALQKYFDDNFVPERMTLTLKGPQSLNHLQKLAISHFGTIGSDSRKDKIAMEKCKQKDLVEQFAILRDTWNKRYDTEVFGPHHLGKCLLLESDLEPCLRIIFPTTSLNGMKDQPLYERTLANILGDESEGSLCFWLRDVESLISLVLAFNDTLCVGCNILVLELDLTLKGQKNVQQILAKVFTFIKQVIINSKVEEVSRYLRESAIIDMVNHVFLEEEISPMEKCSQLAEDLQQNMAFIKPENLLRGYDDWCDLQPKNSMEDESFWTSKAEKLISIANDVLSLTNFNLIVMQSRFYDLETISHDNKTTIRFEIDPYYGFHFASISIDIFKIYKEQVQCSPHITFPEPNHFITHSLPKAKTMAEKLKNVGANEVFYYAKKNFYSSVPDLIDYSNFHEIWYKREFGDGFIHKIVCSCKLQSVRLESSPENTINMELLSEIIGHKLRYKMYPAERAGYNWGIYPSFQGTTSFTLTTTGMRNGFCQFLLKVWAVIFDTLTAIKDISYHDFMKARVAVRSRYKQIANGEGLKQAIVGSTVFLEENVWDVEERISALEMLDLGHLVKFCKEFLVGNKYSTILLQGDICHEESVRILECIIPITHSNHKSPDQRELVPPHEPSSYIYKEGKNYLFERMAAKSDPCNTALHYIQTGHRNDIKTRTMTKLLSHHLASLSVAELRNKRQLGYNVVSGLRICRASMGLYIAVMSSTYDSHYLYNEILDFLSEWESMVERFGDEEFRLTLCQNFILNHNTNAAKTRDGFPSNLIYASEPVMMSSSFSTGENFETHKNYWEKIVNKTYRFSASKGEEEIDIALIQKLTKADFLNYFKPRVSVRSSTRASLSILITSQISQHELRRERLVMTLKQILGKNGFKIDDYNLELIVRNCGYNPKLVKRLLYKHFKEKKEGMKFAYLMTSQASKSILKGIVTKNEGSLTGLKHWIRAKNDKKAPHDNFFHIEPTCIRSYKDIQAESLIAQDLEFSEKEKLKHVRTSKSNKLELLKSSSRSSP